MNSHFSPLGDGLPASDAIRKTVCTMLNVPVNSQAVTPGHTAYMQFLNGIISQCFASGEGETVRVPTGGFKSFPRLEFQRLTALGAIRLRSLAAREGPVEKADFIDILHADYNGTIGTFFHLPDFQGLFVPANNSCVLTLRYSGPYSAAVYVRPSRDDVSKLCNAYAVLACGATQAYAMACSALGHSYRGMLRNSTAFATHINSFPSVTFPVPHSPAALTAVASTLFVDGVTPYATNGIFAAHLEDPRRDQGFFFPTGEEMHAYILRFGVGMAGMAENLALIQPSELENPSVKAFLHRTCVDIMTRRSQRSFMVSEPKERQISYH